MRQTLTLLALAAATPAVLTAQSIPVRTLTTPAAEYSEPFSQISGIRELKNGKLVVADNRDKTIQLVDFAGQATKIGREGSGPGEYGLPSAVYAAPGDSTWVFDVLNSRYLVLDPAGKPVATFTTADAAPPAAAAPAPQRGGRADGPGRGGIGFGFAQGIDARGRLYFRLPVIRIDGAGSPPSDSTPIVRWDRRTKTIDTVGKLYNPPAPPPVNIGGDGRGGTFATVRIGNATPFGSSDTYVVTPQGDLAVVRAADYRVDWVTNGRSVTGTPIRYDKVKITEDDKKQFIEARKNQTGTMVVDDGRGRRVQNVPASQLDGGNAPVFPEFKGPFSTGAVAAPNGQVWVPRHMPFGVAPTYDVIDNAGKLVSRVVLPKRTRLLGFGNGAVYLARMDEDDLQYLQRYKW
jgi:hypothetical protein